MLLKWKKKLSALVPGDVNPYSALGKFLRAYFYVRMSQRVGDLPLSEALLGLENPAPRLQFSKGDICAGTQLAG